MVRGADSVQSVSISMFCLDPENTFYKENALLSGTIYQNCICEVTGTLDYLVKPFYNETPLTGNDKR